MDAGVRRRIGGVVLSLTFDVDERFAQAAEDWAERQLMDEEDALEIKAEQSLLEIEHLVSESHEVEFEVDGRTITHHPTADLSAFLESRAEETGLAESELLKLYVDLFARAFLDDDTERPPNAAPPDD